MTEVREEGQSGSEMRNHAVHSSGVQKSLSEHTTLVSE